MNNVLVGQAGAYRAAKLSGAFSFRITSETISMACIWVLTLRATKIGDLNISYTYADFLQWLEESAAQEIGPLQSTLAV